MEITWDIARRLLPDRPQTAHKGTFGHVFIIAGSRGFTGAAKLAGEAAARSGVGLVTVGIPRPLADVVAASLLEVMSLPLPATDAEALSAEAAGPALEFAAGKQAVVLGPGLMQHQETRSFVQAFVERCPTPLLVDADGLNALKNALDAIKRASAPIVLTPHPGEMSRLMNRPTAEIQQSRERCAREFAESSGCVVVLKGHRTVVAPPEGPVYVNPTGNSGLATGGTGDVLSGLIGGLMAQGLSTRDASLLGVYTHGLAGDIAAERMTERGMIARDVLDAIPEAWRRLETAS